MKVIILVEGRPRAEYLRTQSTDFRQTKQDALKFALAQNYLTIAESFRATFQMLDDQGQPLVEEHPKGHYY